MSGLETAAIGLGAAVARAACGIWLGDHRIAAATVHGADRLGVGSRVVRG